MTTTVIDFAEKRLEKISPTELGPHLMRLPARQRLDLILQRADAEAVVAALAEQDFYLSVKEIGAEDALSLLAMARLEQLNHLFDLEWWQKDRIQSARAVEWLDRLARASEDKLLEWLYHADFELLVALFKQWLRVVQTPEDVDLVEARDHLPKNTLDDQYFWETMYPQYEDFFRQFLGVVFEVNYGFYKELMNHVLWAADAEIEEGAYRFHKGRLEDQAIPDFYDALEIYRSLAPGEIKTDKGITPSEDSIPAPSFALAVVPQGDLLGRALQAIKDPALLNTLQLELASLANKVVVADQLPPDNPEALRLAVDKAAAYVNLGLQLVGGDDLQAALTRLKESFLEHLFRLAHTQILQLRNRMQAVCRQGWISRWPKGLNCLDADWLEAAELLLGKTARMLRPYGPAQGPREDFFRTVRDLHQGSSFVAMVESLRKVFDLLAPDPEHLQSVLWQDGQLADLADATIGSMLWTAAARFRLERNWQVEPLSVADWPRVFPLLGADNMEQEIQAWVERLPGDPDDARRIAAYLAPLFKAYREEMAPFDEANPPDPRLTKFFLFKA